MKHFKHQTLDEFSQSVRTAFAKAVECDEPESSYGDYAPGELDKNGYCRNPECRQPGNRWYGFCMRCEEI